MDQYGAFRSEVRAWVKANLPRSLRDGRAMRWTEAGGVGLTPDQATWRRAVADKGWGMPTWPREYGGAGLEAQEARIVAQELARAGAGNPISGMGPMMLGPTLLEFGNEAQKRAHLPGIARGEVVWCQGFSEPGAGSDLASLQTRAIEDGDDLIINGQKVWTSDAQHSDWCFCLVRTDTSQKHAGITLVLFDMKTPGVQVRPIRLISGSSPFCELFLTNVRAPKTNIVGSINGGWNIAKRLLQHERSGLSGSGDEPEALSLAATATHWIGGAEHGELADGDLRARLVRHDMNAHAYRLTRARLARQVRANPASAVLTSILKNIATDLQQEEEELRIEMLGSDGLALEVGGAEAPEADAVRGWLSGKATSIYGGSYEIQNNIIAKRILGLPDPNLARK